MYTCRRSLPVTRSYSERWGEPSPMVRTSPPKYHGCVKLDLLLQCQAQMAGQSDARKGTDKGLSVRRDKMTAVPSGKSRLVHVLPASRRTIFSHDDRTERAKEHRLSGCPIGESCDQSQPTSAPTHVEG